MRLIDLHCDTIWMLMREKNTNLKNNPFCVDVEKMKAAAKASNRSLNNFVESILLNVMYCDNPEDVTMASIEEARKQQAAYKNGTLDVKPIDLSNVDNMLKSMGL